MSYINMEDIKTDELIQVASSEDVVKEQVPLTEEQETMLIMRELMQQFINQVKGYQGSKKQIQNAWVNAAISPFNDRPLSFSYQEEADLFDTFNELAARKFMLMVYGLEKHGRIKILVPFSEPHQKTPSELELEKIAAESSKESSELSEEKKGE